MKPVNEKKIASDIQSRLENLKKQLEEVEVQIVCSHEWEEVEDGDEFDSWKLTECRKCGWKVW